jgi:dephospho-CoA kinase
MTAAASDPRPLLIALTGGIASGKSAVADLFAGHGVPVLDTDRIARDVVEPGTPAFAQILETFGRDVLDARGVLDRRRLRERVFADSNDRQRLEAITHPAIREELARRATRAGGAYQIHVIPLLVEGGRTSDYDRVLVVDCPAEDQLRRLMSRDRTDAEQARQILAAQATREQRLEAADDVIVNTGTLEDLEQFVATLHRNYALLAQRRW